MGQVARERGFLLIADMESSTVSKFLLKEADAFHTLREHNHLIIEHCLKAVPVAGLVLNSLGDAVVAKFPIGEDTLSALASCLDAARRIIDAFEQLPPIRTASGRDFHLRTKILLQSYDAFSYGRREDGAWLAEELVGPDIDLAFRLAPVAWRLQVLVTETFMHELLVRADPGAAPQWTPQALLDRAHIARHSGALTAGPLQGIAAAFRLGTLDYWISDAREIARLKGFTNTRRVFALAFESPGRLVQRGALQRLTIKVRQHHHAIILASVAAGPQENDDYIEHIVEKLRDATDGNRLDSELTLFAAAKIYGEFDFFFRVSCIDDESLRRFFHAISADSFGVSQVEVRSVVTDRFAITRCYDAIFRRLEGRPYEIVLTWFERLPNRDIFGDLRRIMESPQAGSQAVEILEVGEVIHHTPVYAIFVCERLRDYAAFFKLHGLRPTACRSHVGHIDRGADAQLRYSLMNGVYLPRRIEEN